MTSNTILFNSQKIINIVFFISMWWYQNCTWRLEIAVSVQMYVFLVLMEADRAMPPLMSLISRSVYLCLFIEVEYPFQFFFTVAVYLGVDITHCVRESPIRATKQVWFRYWRKILSNLTNSTNEWIRGAAVNDSQWKALCWHHRPFCTCFSHLLGFKQVSKWGQREILDLVHPVGWDEPDGKKTCVVVHNKSFRHQLFIFPSRRQRHNRASQVHGLQWLLTVPIAKPFTRF